MKRRRLVRIIPDPFHQTTGDNVLVGDSLQVPTNMKLTAEVFASLDRATKLKQPEIGTLLRVMMKRKNWSIEFMASMLNLGAVTIRKIIGYEFEPPGPTVRLIWLIYCIDSAPGMLNDPIYWATWGRQVIRMPRKHDKEQEEVKKYFAELVEAKISMTMSQIVCVLANRGTWTDNKTVGTIGRELGYKFLEGGGGRSITSPTSVWMHVDWSRTTPSIAKSLGQDYGVVARVRRQLKAMPDDVLISHFVAAGRQVEEALVVKRIDARCK